jgi:hypothetical protein
MKILSKVASAMILSTISFLLAASLSAIGLNSASNLSATAWRSG